MSTLSHSASDEKDGGQSDFVISVDDEGLQRAEVDVS